MSQGIRTVWGMALAALLLPDRCAGCGVMGASPCGACLSALRPAPKLDPPTGLDTLAALVRYDEVARALVTAVKYRNARGSIAGLAGAAASLLDPDDMAGATLTWAPTTPDRLRRRGFDQAELLARAIGRHARLPVRACLDRLPGAHQTGLRAAERHRAPHFTARHRPSTTVVVVDDVCTTGATLSAAAGALRAAGARHVHGLVLARTPPREDHR